MDTLSAFKTIDIRVGTVLSADPLTNVRKPAYKLTIDFGDEVGRKQSAAQITDHYDSGALVGKQVLAAVNLPPKRIGPFVSEVLVLGVADQSDKVVLIVPERPAPNGAKMF